MSSTPEYETIENCTEKLEIAFKEADRALVHHLTKEGFINDSTRGQVLNPRSMLTKMEKAGILVEGIKSAIVLDKNKFHALVADLRTRGKFYSPIVTILTTEFDQLAMVEVNKCHGNGTTNHFTNTGLFYCGFFGILL